LYERGATDEELASLCLTRADYASDAPLTYWPDTRAAVELFRRVATQWRTGAAGATGLDYAAIYPLMDRMGLSADAWDDLFSDIQVMEAEALDAMHEKDSDGR